MKIVTLFIISIHIVSPVISQSKSLNIPMLTDSDTSLWYKWQQEYAKKISLPDLTKSRDSLHFRIWSEIQAVDIWTNDHKIFFGSLSNYTRSAGKTKPEKFYSTTSLLDSITSQRVFNLFTANKIFEIPTDKNIKGWSPGFDGEEFLIEFSTPANYNFKEYWTPSFYKEIKEAAAIDSLVKELKSMLHMDMSWQKFLSSLPKGCYHSGSYFVTCNNFKPRKKKG